MTQLTIEQRNQPESIALATVPRFIFGPVALLAILALAFPWPSGHWAVKLGWTMIASYGLFCWTSCFHEAVHQTLCGSKTFSIYLGKFLGTMMFVPYHSYRESHIRHHAYLNKSTDWELWPYSDPQAALWFRRLYCWLEIPCGVFTSPYVYSRIYFHKDSPIQDPMIRLEIRNEYIVIVLVWSAILGTVTYTQTWPIFIAAWVVPHLIAGVYQTFRKFTEHLGMQSYDPLLGTRTVIGNGWITKAATYLNFDIFVHGPHHRHPRYRHDALCDRMEEYQQENPELKYPVFPTYWHAILDVLPVLVFNPGVGMNAGAAAPAGEISHDVSDFAADITSEILSPQDAIVPAEDEDWNT